MKLALLVPLAVMAACKANPDDYPPGGGGGGGVGGGGADGGVDGNGDAGAMLRGRVCVIDDLRRVGDPAACATTGVTGLRLAVSLGTRTATPRDDGGFDIQAPLGAGFVWRVNSSQVDTVIPSVMPFGTDNTIPVVRFERYLELLSTNSAMVAESEGSIVIRVVKNTTTGNIAAASASAVGAVRYDTQNDADSWGEIETGPFGVVWIAPVDIPNPATSISVTFTTQGTPIGGPLSVTVEPLAITFVTQDLR